jgi:hypothetical protein
MRLETLVIVSDESAARGLAKDTGANHDFSRFDEEPVRPS